MTVETLITEAVKQAPGMLVLLYIVVRFLSHLDSIEERRQEADERREKADEKYAAVIERNTVALGRTSAALDRLEDHLDAVAKKSR